VGVVDAGTIEFVRSLGPEVASSADLVQRFEAVWPAGAYPLYRRAAEALIGIKDRAFAMVFEALAAGRPVTEQGVAREILRLEEAAGLVPDPPIVGVGAHAADPHHAPLEADDAVIGPEQPLLIDLFARVDDPVATVADFTYMGFTGASPADAFVAVWESVCRARDAALDRVRTAVEGGDPIMGCEIDAAAREVITGAGYERGIRHRTGHSLGHQTHGAGMHADGLEMKDERHVIPGIAFTIEPGIYLEELGVRTEINVLAHDGAIEVWQDPPQTELIHPAG